MPHYLNVFISGGSSGTLRGSCGCSGKESDAPYTAWYGEPAGSRVHAAKVQDRSLPNVSCDLLAVYAKFCSVTCPTFETCFIFMYDWKAESKCDEGRGARVQNDFMSIRAALHTCATRTLLSVCTDQTRDKPVFCWSGHRS